jgi:cob(I)alamin adenosyltransferase
MSGHGGDRGMTGLLSGERVPKTHPRVEACGEVDELASVLGAVAAALPDTEAGLRSEIVAVQEDLLRVGARVAATPGSPAAAMLPPLSEQRLAAVEESSRKMEASLPRLQSFIVPGGHPSAAWAHVARAVCRRAERRVVALAGEDPGVAEGVIAYLNRLSAWLFDLARWCNRMHGVPEMTWKG